MKLFTQIFLILFCSSQLLSAALSNPNRYPTNINSFKQLIFYLENNKIEKNKINPKILTNNFEKDFVEAILKYKQNNFEDSYRLLFTHLKEKPAFLKYYEYLVRTAGILNKYSDLTDYIIKTDNDTDFLYMSALIDYYQANYNSAKTKFSKLLQSEPNSIEALIYLSSSQRRLGDYNSARNSLQVAGQKITKIDEKAAEILVLSGSLFFLSDRYNEAVKIYKKALETAKVTGNNIEAIKAILNLGMINDLSGNIPKARKLFKKSYSLAKKINQKELEALVLSEWAVSFTYSNEPVEARKRYEESYSIFQAFHNRERIAFTAINIASLYLNIGNYKGALNYYNIALQNSVENVRPKMLAYRGLGDVYTNLANYTKALQYYKDAKEIAKKIKDISTETEINIGIGIFFYNLGKYQNALEYLLENYQEIKRQEQPYLKAELNQKLGIVYLSTGDYHLAKKYLTASINLSEKLGDIYNSILSKTYLAYSYKLNNNIIKGINILRKQLKLCKKNNYSQLAGIQLLMLSETKSGIKKYHYLTEALKFSIDANDKSTLIEIYFNMGKYYRDLKQYDNAKVYLLKAISIIENQLPVLKNSSDMQITFFSNYHKIYTSLTNLYLKTNNVQKAFRTLDQSRSRNTLYNLIGIKFSEANDIDLVNNFYDLNWQQQNNLGNSDSLKIRLQIIKNKLINKYPEFAYIFNFTNKTSVNLQSDIFSDSEYFISYFFDSDSIYVFKASRNSLKLIKLNASISYIKNIVSSISPYFNRKIMDKDIHFNKDLFSFNPTKANELYKILIEPVLRNVPKNAELIFSLPNELVMVPFEFLSTGEQNKSGVNSLFNNKYLVEDYSISYSPSFSIWTELKSRTNSKNSFALLAGDPDFKTIGEGYSSTRSISDNLDLYSRNIKVLPLRYSSKEIEDIEGYFNNDMILLKDKATESNFKKYAHSASIIHLATHSFLFKNYPVILFTKDAINDGYLEIGEVAKLHLTSDMVVLSSCKSGLGNMDNAEGILGMQKVFFDAGSSSIVLSLWDVSDKYTTTLMKFFYEFLSEGLTKSKALRNAKIKFINTVNPNPYYWAAFTLSGNSNPILLEKDSKNYSYLFGFLVLLLLIYLFIKKKHVFVK